MSLTATVPSQAQTEWVRIFPKQVTETYTSSVTFMKQLTTVAVSTISYLKNLFPEDNYTDENFGGIKLKILKKKCRDELAQFMSTALTQAFEAFEKKYLHKLAICFYDGECNVDNLAEYHMFEYSYTPSGVSMEVSSKGGRAHSYYYSFDRVRDRTLKLIHSCIIAMHTCENKLTAPYDVSLRLYYNDDAPEGYQAPGFSPTGAGAEHLAWGATGVQLGVVRTPFHLLQAWTYRRPELCSPGSHHTLPNDMPSSYEAQASQNNPMMTQNEGDSLNSLKMSFERSETECSVGRVVCACEKYEGDGELMLTCEYCGTLQHAACYGRVTLTGQEGHCCVRCSDAEPTRAPTDPRLAELTSKKRESLCIMRRALAWCAVRVRDGVRLAELRRAFQLSHLNALKLLHLLHSNGVLEVEVDHGDILSPRKIIAEQLIKMMERLFTERSVAHAQDPLDHVLGPMEQVTLQNATTLGKIIEPSPQVTVIEDATLKQYKQVVLSNNQSEELPLSGNHNPVKDMDTIGKRTSKRKADKENVRAGVRTKKAKSNN